jgi:hypothetical protein
VIVIYVCITQATFLLLWSRGTLPERVSQKETAGFSSAGGSTGVRFSGDKVRNYSPETSMRTSFDILMQPKEEILFPADSDQDTTSGGFGKDCLQWAVVTTIHVPNESIIGVAGLRNWCLVIVGDTITPDDAYHVLAKKDNVFYLSASYQKKFLMNSKHSFVEMMPFKSFARKNIGYLFALSYGARVLFDFDDDNILVPLEDGETIPPPFHFDDDHGFDRTVLLKFIKSEKQDDETIATNNAGNGTRAKEGATESKSQRPALAFNPYPFMGASHKDSWPRGFPIDQLQKNFVEWDLQKTTVGDIKYSFIGVIQSLCNGDPDNDAVFRLTQRDATHFTFDRSARSLPLLIPSSAYSPYNAQATTHLYNAFWGLYLPITVPGRVTDIWRSYITQRIMKDIGLHVLYTPPIVNHERSAHDYLSDFVAERDLYDKTTKLLEFLDGWASNAESLSERIFDLWICLYERDYIGLHDVKAVKEWLNVLHVISYKFPDVKTDDDFSIIDGPLAQPSIDGQPYISLPYFNDGAIETIPNERPGSAILKLIMMTMDEWPLMKSWVLVS